MPQGPLLSVAIVSFQPEPLLFQRVLQALEQALAAVQNVFAAPYAVTVVDHSPDPTAVAALCAPWRETLSLTLLHDGANPGFGAGHNRALGQSQAPFHLILNPDVILSKDSLVALLQYLRAHPAAALLGPEVHDGQGHLSYPCKAEPTVLDLALRGFAPRWLKRRFDARLARYECRALVEARQVAPALHLSGCCLMARTEALRAVGGFDEGYFLYFEDFALSRALRNQGEVLYCPLATVEHHGGDAARKGLRHVRYFGASAWRWFRQRGWRWG
ncbi:MAG TPA: glycosyltransferase family 2 protein [Hyphomicrobiales bacterium]|nr:glycosyltransferase family 2 protein [Hyphomicrobiales bacterium]